MKVEPPPIDHQKLENFDQESSKIADMIIAQRVVPSGLSEPTSKSITMKDGVLYRGDERDKGGQTISKRLGG